MTSSFYQDVSYAAMRFLAGGLFAFHGAQKLFGLFGGKVMTGSPKMLAAGLIELAGGLLIAFGLFTIVAAFVASGEMAVAYFTVHAKGGFGLSSTAGSSPSSIASSSSLSSGRVRDGSAWTD